MPKLSNRVHTFTDSVIRRMTRISNKHGAINLSQGFPESDPPKEIMEALAKAAYQGPHQYSVTFGAKNFRDALARKQGKAIYIPLVPPEYNFDIRLIEKGFSEGAKAIIICNPSNPCGKVFTREELMAIGELALKYDAFVVTDEVFMLPTTTPVWLPYRACSTTRSPVIPCQRRIPSPDGVSAISSDLKKSLNVPKKSMIS